MNSPSAKHLPEYIGFLILTDPPEMEISVPSEIKPADNFAAIRGKRSLAKELALAKINVAQDFSICSETTAVNSSGLY